MITQDRFSCQPDCLDGDQLHVEGPVVVRAQHHNVLQRVGSAVFPIDDVRDVARGCVPAADGAAVEEFASDHQSEGAGRGIDASAGTASRHGFRMPDTEAFSGAVDVSVRVLTCQLLGWKVLDRLAACVAWLRFPRLSWIRRVELLPSEFTGVAAEASLSTGCAAFPPRDWLAAVFTRLRCSIASSGLEAVFAAPAGSRSHLYPGTPRNRLPAVLAGLARDVVRVTSTGHDLSITWKEDL